MYNVAEPFERLRMQQEEEDGNDDTAYKPIPEFEYDLFKSSGHSEDKEERLVLLCSVLVGSLSIHFFRCLQGLGPGLLFWPSRFIQAGLGPFYAFRRDGGLAVILHLPCCAVGLSIVGVGPPVPEAQHYT